MKPTSNIWIFKMKRLVKGITLHLTETIQKIYLSVAAVRVKKVMMTNEIDDSECNKVTWIQYLVLKINMFSILNTYVPMEKTSSPSSTSPWLNIYHFQHFFVGRSDHPNNDRPRKVHLTDIFKYELHSVDPRVSMNIPNIFWKTRQMADKASFAVCQNKDTNKNKLTAKHVREMQTCCHTSYRMQQILSSQGSKVHSGHLNIPHCSFGEIDDYFHRVEFQRCGSPYIHGLIWVTGAPRFDKNSDEDISEYIDKCITCSGEIKDWKRPFSLFQIYKHSQTCMKVKNGKKVSCFGTPWLPMQKHKYCNL